MVIHQRMWIQWLFYKKLTKRSMTPRRPFTPLLLRSNVWPYPRIIVSKSHEDTSKYVDTVTLLFPKTWTKGHWPQDDLCPHICWGHTCNSTQGSLCPNPMGIHQCMWIQWSILQNYHIVHTTYIHNTYYVQNEWSHSWRSGTDTFSKIRSVIFCVTKFSYKNCLLESHLPIIMLVL